MLLCNPKDIPEIRTSGQSGHLTEFQLYMNMYSPLIQGQVTNQDKYLNPKGVLRRREVPPFRPVSRPLVHSLPLGGQTRRGYRAGVPAMTTMFTIAVQ